ncbi:MAG: hypothetical protein ACJAV2_004902 [Myxococcota bacterium]|jgi:hypothetical protein
MCGRGLCLPSSTSPNRREARRLVDEWVEMLPDPTWRDQVRAVARPPRWICLESAQHRFGRARCMT